MAARMSLAQATALAFLAARMAQLLRWARMMRLAAMVTTCSAKLGGEVHVRQGYSDLVRDPRPLLYSENV